MIGRIFYSMSEVTSDELVVMSWKDIGYFEVDPMKINRVCSCSRDECKKKKEERGGRRKARSSCRTNR